MIPIREMDGAEGRYWVPSERESDVSYDVSLADWACTCPASRFAQRNGGLVTCKHLRDAYAVDAIDWLRRLERSGSALLEGCAASTRFPSRRLAAALLLWNRLLGRRDDRREGDGTAENGAAVSSVPHSMPKPAATPAAPAVPTAAAAAEGMTLLEAVRLPGYSRGYLSHLVSEGRLPGEKVAG
jgi:hypothetical protein